MPVLVEPSPQLMVAVKSPLVAARLASVKVATVAPLMAPPSFPLMPAPVAVSAASVMLATARCARGAAALVADRHADRVAALVRIGVAARDGERAVAAADRAGAGRAVAPVDRRREVGASSRRGWRR